MARANQRDRKNGPNRLSALLGGVLMALVSMRRPVATTGGPVQQVQSVRWLPVGASTTITAGNGYIVNGPYTLTTPPANTVAHGDFFYARPGGGDWTALGYPNNSSDFLITPGTEPNPITWDNAAMVGDQLVTVVYQTSGFGPAIAAANQVPRWVIYPGMVSVPQITAAGSAMTVSNGPPTAAPANPAQPASMWDSNSDTQWDWDPADLSWHSVSLITSTSTLASLPADTWTLVPLGPVLYYIDDFQAEVGTEVIDLAVRSPTVGRPEVNSLQGRSNITFRLTGKGRITP
jgi:hypothetical protein